MTARSLVLLVPLFLSSATILHAQDKPRRDRNVITLEELEKIKARSPYEVIQRLRPLWLRSRGVSGVMDSPVTKETGMPIYVDGVRRGGVIELQAIPLEQVQEIRHMSAEEAVTRYGSDLPFGTIEVITKKGSP